MKLKAYEKEMIKSTDKLFSEFKTLNKTCELNESKNLVFSRTESIIFFLTMILLCAKIYTYAEK